MWLAILTFLRSEWKYVVPFILGQLVMIPLIVWFNARNDATIADLKTEISTIRSTYADQALAARTDADKQRADSLAAVQKTYTDIVSGLLQVNAQLVPAVTALNSNFKVLQNDPSYACLYKPLPVNILNSLQISAPVATRH
jgi:hypothetical protein